MVEVSPALRERSRKNETAILSALAERSQVRVAELLNTSESTISLMKKDGRIEQMASFLSALGLKLVGESAAVYEADYVNALRTLAAEGIKRAPEAGAER